MKLPVKAAVWMVVMAGTIGPTHASTSPASMRVDALATVDAQGHVHQIVTRQRLTPQLGQALRQDLSGWVQGPVRRDGRNSWSQTMFHLVLETAPLAHGDVTAHFRLLSAEPAAYDDQSIASRWGNRHRPLSMPMDPPPPPAAYVAKAGGTTLP